MDLQRPRISGKAISDTFAPVVSFIQRSGVETVNPDEVQRRFNMFPGNRPVHISDSIAVPKFPSTSVITGGKVVSSAPRSISASNREDISRARPPSVTRAQAARGNEGRPSRASTVLKKDRKGSDGRRKNVIVSPDNGKTTLVQHDSRLKTAYVADDEIIMRRTVDGAAWLRADKAKVSLLSLRY